MEKRNAATVLSQTANPASDLVAIERRGLDLACEVPREFQ
jgi:hypothetical protein